MSPAPKRCTIWKSPTITFDGYSETSITNGATTTITYFSANGQRIAMHWNSVLYYLLADSLNSSTVVLKDDGTTQGAQLFAPYGAVRHASGTMPTTYNFTGQRLDSETGLLYYNARYYDPFSGRFVRADTVQSNADGMDPYAYVGNNPETANDPTGEMMCSDTCHSSGGGSPSITPGNTPPLGSTNASSNQVSSCGTMSQVDCLVGMWHTRSYWQGYVETQTTVNTTPTGLACFGFCISVPGSQISLSHRFFAAGAFDSAIAGCASLFSCISQGEGVDDKPSDDAEALGFGCSFIAQTPVKTAHGEQAISTLKVGEKVLAYNSKTGKMELQPILHVWLNHDNDLVDLTITTPEHAPHSTQVTKTSEVIHTNQKHPFLTIEKGFVPVKQLHVGMHVLRADGHIGMITGWKIVPGVQVMYNLTVQQDHTFVVGVGQWVVHNTCIPDDWEQLDYGSDNKAGVSDFIHTDQLGNKLEATYFHDTGDLQIAWMDSLKQAKDHLPELVNWLGDVQIVRGYLSANLAEYFSSGSRGLTAINRMFSLTLEDSGFAPGTIELEGNKIWIVFKKSTN